MLQRIHSLARSLAARVSEGRIPTWLLGLLVALLTWRVQFLDPVGGVDTSWHAGLAMAAHQNLQFGTEVIFTYGPLGFLVLPWLFYGDLGILAFCYSAVLHVGLASALVWTLRRNLSIGVAALVAVLTLLLLPKIEVPIAIAAILCLGMLRPARPPMGLNLFVLVGASLAAVEALAKISLGPLIFVMVLVTLIGARARWSLIAAFAGLFVGEFVLLWVVLGQSLANLNDFVANSAQVISGYNEAMATRASSSVWSLVAVLLPLGVVAASAAARYRDSFARWAGVALVAVTTLSLFKEGVVRFDDAHVVLYVSTVYVVWLAIPWAEIQRPLLISGAAILAAIALHVEPPIAPELDPVGNLRLFGQQVRLLVSDGRRTDRQAAARAAMIGGYRLDPPTLAALRGHAVSVDPSEIGVAWAYDLDWSPLPVFQNYSAYTHHLDELNAAAIEDPSGPERILRQVPTPSVDGRFPGWDPPAQAIATLCHFEPLRTTASWQVLGRTANRCGAPRPIRSVESSFGETVPVPAPGPDEVVFARIEGVGIDGTERLRAIFWRPRSRYAIVNGKARYRVVPGTAEDGLMLRASRGVAGPGAVSQVPQARTIMLRGTGGDLRYEFFRIKVRPAGRPDAGSGRG